MKTYPLQSISIDEAIQKQFRLVDCISKNFTGTELLSRGDLGVHQPENEPLTTAKAEKTVADFLMRKLQSWSEDQVLVQSDMP